MLFFATLVDIGLALVVFLLVFAAIQKLRALDAFRAGLLFIPYIKEQQSILVANLLPPVEIAIAVGLSWNVVPAKVAALLLFGCFIVVTWLTIGKNLNVTCRCFGLWDDRILSKETIVMNSAFIGSVLLSLRFEKTRLEWADMAIAIALFFAVAIWRELRENTLVFEKNFK